MIYLVVCFCYGQWLLVVHEFINDSSYKWLHNFSKFTLPIVMKIFANRNINSCVRSLVRRCCMILMVASCSLTL
jgi:hypothetical protein